MTFLSAVPGGNPREIVRHFTPNWFAANMGTGILALMLALFPYGHWGQLDLARALWCINSFFFVLFGLLFIGRAVFYAESFRRLFDHPVQSLFLGAIPMGFATIINGFFIIWPLSATTLAVAHAFWWIDVLLSALSVLLVPFFMFTSQGHSMERMTAAWLLPIVPPEVAAASGGLLAPHLAPAAAENVIYTSYILWSVSVLLALGVLAILLLRLTLHKLPHQDMAVSSWLPLGPLGTGAMAMITLGNADFATFHGELAEMAHFAQMAGLLVALILWGFGLWWMLMAVAFTLRYLREGLPFNMGWWGFTFPLGVFDSATYLLADKTGYWLFEPLGAFFTVLLAFFWIVVTRKSFVGMWTGRLFRAPCLSEETGLPQSCERPAVQQGGDIMSTLRQ
ncbi:TDT family transporter [Candidatus Igneacidithiobacillus taiwanensis]|uniref:TDT family transporter n=1 Tax=Candidatus Igneacidithiobacillus taiwanensis TaxID=1945924 RepID=UPI0028991C0A|nr:TDT family transporter [Candidatus Igneacidithiobacillus taiwanensis]